MKCSICGNELRPMPSFPPVYACDHCRKYVDEDRDELKAVDREETIN